MIKGTYIKNSISFALLAVMMCFLFIWNINSGSVHLSVEEIGGILFRRTGEAASYRIVWDIRLPRILSAVILGGALSVSGFLLQTFFANPIAGPFVLGISSGAKLVATMTGMRYEIGLVLFGIILVVYTIFGGAKGTSIVSVFQGFIMTVTTVALMVGLFTYVRSDYGTVEKAFRSLALTDPSILTPTAQFSLTGLMSYLFLTGMSGAVGSNNVSRAVQIGSSKALHRSTIMTILFIGFWSCIMPFLGTLGKTVFPDIASDTIIPYAALMVLPPVFAGIVVAGVTSAIHSTLAVNMLTVNASVVMDLYGSLIKPEATDKELQKVNTISTAALIVLMTLFAIKPPALIGVINNFAIAGGAAAFFIPMLLGTWWKRANEYGCIASMVGGVGYYFLATFNPVFAFNMNPIIPSLIVALLAMVIVSVATPAPEKEIVDIWFGADYGTRAANHS